MPKLIAIWAQGEENAIGVMNRLPWKLPEDLSYFKVMTMGSPLIMGRKTLESLPGLLPGRPHIVLTRNPGALRDGVIPVKSLQAGIDAATKLGTEQVFVTGGAEVYALALPLVDEILVTEVHLEVPGADAWAPAIPLDVWARREKSPILTSKSGLRYQLLRYTRR